MLVLCNEANRIRAVNKQTEISIAKLLLIVNQRSITSHYTRCHCIIVKDIVNIVIRVWYVCPCGTILFVENIRLSVWSDFPNGRDGILGGSIKKIVTNGGDVLGTFEEYISRYTQDIREFRN